MPVRKTVPRVRGRFVLTHLSEAGYTLMLEALREKLGVPVGEGECRVSAFDERVASHLRAWTHHSGSVQ